MARTLKQTVFAGGVIYAAGTPEADVKADVPDQFWDGEPAAGDDKGYGDLKLAELKDEIAKRNEGRDDDAKIPTEGNKADLVKALEADDQES